MPGPLFYVFRWERDAFRLGFFYNARQQMSRPIVSKKAAPITTTCITEVSIV